jgi:GT2 family glycosyltransferase
VSSYPAVHAIVLNFNRAAETAACVETLLKSDYPNLRIWVLDYGDPFEAYRQRYPQVQILRLSENLGYAGNNNIGIRAALQAGAEWIFLLNEDTTLAPDCVSELMKAAQSADKIGMLGPLVYHAAEPQIIQTAGGMLGKGWSSIHLGQNQPDQGQFQQVQEVRWLTGCGILVSARLIAQVGLLDERFFLYWEETEWCLRAAEAGWRILNVPGAHLWHKGVSRDYQPSPAITYYSTRNHFFIMSLHHAAFGDWVLAYLQHARPILSWSLRPRWRAKRAHRDAKLRGILDFWRGRWGPVDI